MLRPQVLLSSGNWTCDFSHDRAKGGSPINSGSVWEIRNFLISCLDTAQKNVREGLDYATARREEEAFQQVSRGKLSAKLNLLKEQVNGLNSEEACSKTLYSWFLCPVPSNYPRVSEDGGYQTSWWSSNYDDMRISKLAFQVLTAIEYLIYLYINLSTYLSIELSIDLSIFLLCIWYLCKECERELTNLCDKHAFCNNTIRSYTCYYKQRFAGARFNCTSKKT